MADIPEDTRKKLEGHLTSIAKLFRAPLITLIVRSPEGGNVKGDLVLGNDNPTAVIAALRARMVAEAEVLAKEGRGGK